MDILINKVDDDGYEDKSFPLFRFHTIIENRFTFEVWEESPPYDLNYYMVKNLHTVFDNILQNCHDQKSFEEYIKLLRNV